MKSFVLSFVLLLALGFAGTGPAAAAIHSDAKVARSERPAALLDSGTHLQRQRVARAAINDAEDYYTRSDTGRSAKSKQDTTKRYTKKGKRKHYAQGKKKKYASGKSKRKIAYGKSKKRIAVRPSKPKTAAIRRTPGSGSLSQDGPLGSGQLGIASFYWQPQRVAAGGWFNPSAMTAAHKTLPFGTRVRVTHLGNGKSVEVKINDRGPYVAGRIIDLSKAAAGIIGMHDQGIAKVKVTVLGR